MDYATLTHWYLRNHRALPWRKTRDPYRIWLSEVILQQTRVAQGLEYYNRFTGSFPSIAELAAATEDEVLKLWQGLGYYSRARNLHAAAKQVVAEYGGIFPTEYAAVRALKGIGDYTAAAIVSFATDAPYAVVDGNVYRVLGRLLDIATPIDTTAGKKEFAAAATELLNDYLAAPKRCGTLQPGCYGVGGFGLHTALAAMPGMPAGRELPGPEKRNNRHPAGQTRQNGPNPALVQLPAHHRPERTDSGLPPRRE